MLIRHRHALSDCVADNALDVRLISRPVGITGTEIYDTWVNSNANLGRPWAFLTLDHPRTSLAECLFCTCILPHSLYHTDQVHSWVPEADERLYPTRTWNWKSAVVSFACRAMG